MATKLECFILPRSEVVLTLALLYSHAHSTEKHIFHKFLTRQIAHWNHHSSLVIPILFTPIKKKKKRTAKHRTSENESQRRRAWLRVLGRAVLTAWHFHDARSCMPAEIPAQVPQSGGRGLSGPASALNSSPVSELVLSFCLHARRCNVLCSGTQFCHFAVEKIFKEGTGAILEFLSVTR